MHELVFDLLKHTPVYLRDSCGKPAAPPQPIEAGPVEPLPGSVVSSQQGRPDCCEGSMF
jgi:hypothetical protein